MHDNADKILNDIDRSDIHQDGLYRLFLVDGGSIVASVGHLHNGTLWYAPSNWVAKDTTGIVSTDWSRITKAVLVEVQVSHYKCR